MENVDAFTCANFTRARKVSYHLGIPVIAIDEYEIERRRLDFVSQI
jgi:hypothetical protein